MATNIHLHIHIRAYPAIQHSDSIITARTFDLQGETAQNRISGMPHVIIGAVIRSKKEVNDPIAKKKHIAKVLPGLIFGIARIAIDAANCSQND